MRSKEVSTAFRMPIRANVPQGTRGPANARESTRINNDYNSSIRHTIWQSEQEPGLRNGFKSVPSTNRRNESQRASSSANYDVKDPVAKGISGARLAPRLGTEQIKEIGGTTKSRRASNARHQRNQTLANEAGGQLLAQEGKMQEEKLRLSHRPPPSGVHGKPEDNNQGIASTSGNETRTGATTNVKSGLEQATPHHSNNMNNTILTSTNLRHARASSINPGPQDNYLANGEAFIHIQGSHRQRDPHGRDQTDRTQQALAEMRESGKLLADELDGDAVAPAGRVQGRRQLQ